MSNSSVAHLFKENSRYADVAKVGLATARKRGLKYYWTDEPCKHGHVSFRRTTTQKCIQCDRERYRATVNTKYRTRDKNLGIKVNGEVRRAIENKLLDLQLAREEAWYV